MRQAALKWILVTCFGYLGYRDSRFGRVDAHIAVCAFARDALLKTARLAEEREFEVVHGIVDSLWLKKPRVSPKEVAELIKEASNMVGVPLNVEGKSPDCLSAFQSFKRNSCFEEVLWGSRRWKNQNARC